MKKLLSVILAALLVFSVFSVAAAAETTNVFDDLTSEKADTELYCIVYTSETLSGVKMMYVPSPTTSFDGPGYAYATKDTPIAIDHNFVCWKDGHGRYYYPGDRVYVNGVVNLYAVWEEKTDNDSHVFRIIKAALASLQRIIEKVFGVFKDFKEFDDAYNETTTTTEPVIEPLDPDIDPDIGG